MVCGMITITINGREVGGDDEAERMKAEDVFPFIEHLFESGILKNEGSMWRAVYGLSRNRRALAVAEGAGLDEVTFERWLHEFVRMCVNPPTLTLDIACRYGWGAKPERVVVPVNFGSLKDFEHLQESLEIHLLWALGDVYADEYLNVRPLRKPDVPDVWARVRYEGEEYVLRFSPLDVFRGQVREFYDWKLQNVEVLEWLPYA